VISPAPAWMRLEKKVCGTPTLKNAMFEAVDTIRGRELSHVGSDKKNRNS
jgi:hypothetical protein